MFLQHNAVGYTMIELLVVLVMIGLLSAVTVPALDSWLSSRQASLQREELASMVALLPLKAKFSGEVIRYETAQDFPVGWDNIEVLSPVIILANGYCQGGSIALNYDNTQYQYAVKSPFCTLQPIN